MLILQGCDGRRHVLADELIDMTKGASRQKPPVLVKNAPVHGSAGVDVFPHCVAHEADRCDDLDFAALDIRFVNHAAYTTEVIGVGVGVDHRHHWVLADFLVDEVKGRLFMR